eukprot:GHVN01030797.1.p3 GENE.GHVN01030797.1~~GHVN01030797.1.p3  ORF type:complete len:119 (+),score=17.73 GHVN01030797.1:100-456(+)
MYFIGTLLIVSSLALAQENEEESIGVIKGRDVVGVISPQESDDDDDGTPSGYVDDLRAMFPKCPPGCENDWLGDGWCDKECNTELCGKDGGDCEGVNGFSVNRTQFNIYRLVYSRLQS